MNDIRQKIVDYAVAQVDKPYAEHGWGPIAYDCIGLFCDCGIANGVFDYDRNKETDHRFRNYSSKADPELLLAALRKYFIKVPRDEVLLGDGLLFRDPKAQHFGVITRLSPIYVVHATLRREPWRVRHERVSNVAYIVCGWRYPGLSDG
jgi:hypothetical protein